MAARLPKRSAVRRPSRLEAGACSCKRSRPDRPGILSLLRERARRLFAAQQPGAHALRVRRLRPRLSHFSRCCYGTPAAARGPAPSSPRPGRQAVSFLCKSPRMTRRVARNIKPRSCTAHANPPRPSTLAARRATCTAGTCAAEDCRLPHSPAPVRSASCVCPCLPTQPTRLQVVYPLLHTLNIRSLLQDVPGLLEQVDFETSAVCTCARGFAAT